MNKEALERLFFVFYLLELRLTQEIIQQRYEMDTCLEDRTLNGAGSNIQKAKYISPIICGIICKSNVENCVAFFVNKNLSTCTFSSTYFITQSATTFEMGSRFYRKSGLYGGMSSCDTLQTTTTYEPTTTTNRPPDCPLNYGYDPVNRFCYKYYKQYKTYDAANSSCNNDGGRLAVIDTTGKHSAAGNIAIANKYKAIRIDGSRAVDQIWRFSDGRLMNTGWFNTGASSYYNQANKCVHIHYHHTVYLYANKCDSTSHYLCEIVIA